MAFLCFISVVVLLCDYRVALQVMYYASIEGMVEGEYGFILYELSPSEVSGKFKNPFKWFYPSWTKTIKEVGKIRDNSFKVVIVLSSKVVSGSYAKFTSQLIERMKDFGSTAYVGMIKGTRKPKNRTSVCTLKVVSYIILQNFDLYCSVRFKK